MKKISKIGLLVLFILFIIGMTTSNATSIIDEIINNAKRSYCMEQSIPDMDDWEYLGDLTEYSYPDFDPVNGHAKAYLYAAADDIKKKDENTENIDEEDIQNGVYHLTNQGEENFMSFLASAFQQFKNDEKPLTLEKSDSAKTIVSEKISVYGPIKIDYNYLYAESGGYYDEWGGFIYTFVDNKGNNVSDRVKLCTLEDGIYKEIKYTKIETNNDVNGYYKVTTGAYKNKDLYVVTEDRKLGRVYLQARSYSIEYMAKIKIRPRKSETALAQRGFLYCTKCRNDSNLISLDSNKWILWFKHDTVQEEKSYKGNVIINNKNIFDYEDGIHVVVRDADTTAKLLEKYVDKDVTIIPSKFGNTTRYICSSCGFTSLSADDVLEHITNNHIICKYEITYTIYNVYKGCNNSVPVWSAQVHGMEDNKVYCGYLVADGDHSSQAREEIEMTTKKEIYGSEVSLEIPFETTIRIKKEWLDYDDQYGLRPDKIYYNVYRSTDKTNWEKLTENVDYFIVREDRDEDSYEWIEYITALVSYDDDGNQYYFKIEEQELDYHKPVYPWGNLPTFIDNSLYGYLTIQNELKHVNLGGYVWIDGQTGIKPAIENNGIMDSSEAKMENIVVHLYQEIPKSQKEQAIEGGGTKKYIGKTQTDANGHYEFKDLEIGLYYVVFDYDGIHYEDTIKVDGTGSQVVAKAFENVKNEPNGVINLEHNRREVFNSRFQTITYGKSNDETTLNYNYADKKSTLITNNDGATTIKTEFVMNAETPQELIAVDTDNLNLGLVNRGTDIAFSTDVYTAQVTINGQATEYTYNSADNSIEIGTTQTEEQVSYNLNLYTSDYTYRIRDYVNEQDFQEKDYINNGENSGISSGEELRVYVTYEVNLQNQSNKTTRINEIKYIYDEKYTYVGLQGGNYAVQNTGNELTINLNGLSLGDGVTSTLYLVFEVNKADRTILLGDFSNKGEITSYSTDEGLIDVDSQPGNFIASNQIEDDNDTAGGITLKVPGIERKITGKVFDNDNGQSDVNDVIVQLIELKTTVNGRTFEYIWQETVSGTGEGKRLTADGQALEGYTYDETDGYYEFKGFIPGDYIVRFIYGDGTTYDMTGNVIKYNGQDYKSVTDSNYKAEWYNTSTYSAGASVARDNEARRLETMAYGVEIDAEKGILLKLLNNLTANSLNETEKETLVTIYNNYYGTSNTEITDGNIAELLKDYVLRNTWMCAETSKIKIAVDTESVENTSIATTVNGVSQSYANNITDINLGLELRPETKIELKKYITGFKLVASNGQTIVNAYVDVNKYLDPEITNISDSVEGVKDYLTILNNVWQYEVIPTDINTIVDGANLEFEYTLVVRNTGADDYLSAELANIYNSEDISTYIQKLTDTASEIKGYIKNGAYTEQIGNSVGNSYYLGGTGTGKVLTEVTNIRDYINNDLTFIFKYEGDVEKDEDAPKIHRILRDDYSMQETEIQTILKTTRATGKMNNTDSEEMYKVRLGKNPISSTGNLTFDTYIAEVMSYTNAAGRRAMTSTPGNAEIIDQERREGRAHEIDEADTGRIQIGVATGEDQATNYVIIIAVAAGIAVVALGAYLIKKYIFKN